MLKKSVKYFAIAVANGVILTFLLALWTDKIALLFDDWIRPVEFLKIIGCGLLSLIAMRIAVGVFRKKNIQSVSTKMKIAAIITFSVSSFLYFPYIGKVVHNCIIHGYSRYKLAKKIVGTSMTSSGEDFSIKEYETITEDSRFPELHREAVHISYRYYFDLFPPNYSIQLKYELPKDIQIDTINCEKGRYSKHQSFEIKADRKMVYYDEIER